MSTTRTAIYTRISNDPKLEGLGVARQLEDCLALAGRQGWTVTARFDDNDTSAYNGKHRPGFEALLDTMKQGQVDALVCWHVDRLYRSMKDLERLIEIADAARVQIKTVQGGDLDLSTSAGRMLARILGSVARQESEHASERRKRAYVQKAQEGRWQTVNRAFGYTMTGQPLEPEATAYRTAVADVLAGKSIRKVAAEWNAAGLKTTLAGKEQTNYGKTKIVTGLWNSPRVRRLLVSPRYAGLKTHRGKVVGKGDWSALIDGDTHRGLVAYLSDPARVKNTSFERKYIGSGVYICGRCGGKMRSARPGGRKSYAYVCRDQAHLLRVGQPLDDFVAGVVLRRLSQPDAHLLLADKRTDIPALQTQRNGLQARLDELAGMFAEGVIDASQLRTGTSGLRVKLAGVDSQLADAARIDPVAGLIAERDQVQAHWESVSPAIRGQIIDALLTVTIMPCPRGSGFDPAYVRIEWK
jgi:site-specific DNA recombinase